MNDGSAPWIKIMTRLFEDSKIVALAQLPEGDSVVLCWFRLLCLAGEQNRGGMIYLSESVAFTSGILASKWRCKPATVEMALAMFQKFGMISIDQEGTISVLNWCRYQNEEGLAQIRERSLKQLQDQSLESIEERRAQKRKRDAERQRKWRQNRKKNDSNGVVTGHTLDPCDNGVTARDMGVTVTPQRGELQRETVTSQIENKTENKKYPSYHPSQREGLRDKNFDEYSPEFSEAKIWISKLFGRSHLKWKRGRKRGWSDEENSLLLQLLPIKRDERDLIEWGYSLPRDAEDWVLLDGKRTTGKPKYNMEAFLREFASELDKWRSVRSLGN